MSVQTIRDAICTTMRTVSGVGVVHNYQRYAHGMDTLKAMYMATGSKQLLGWHVTRLAASEYGRIQPRSVERIDWRIQGVMALDDAAQSELAFDDLVEALRDAFRNDDTLGGTVATCTQPDGNEAGLQVDDAGPVMFANVLCHGVRLSLHTIRYLTMQVTP